MDKINDSSKIIYFPQRQYGSSKMKQALKELKKARSGVIRKVKRALQRKLTQEEIQSFSLDKQKKGVKAW